MRAVIADRAALASVTTLAIHAYLKAQGWTRGKDFGDRGVVYQYGSQWEVFAPGSDRLTDYAEAVAAVVAEVSRVEDRDELAVYRDLVNSDRDLIRFRAPKADDDGSIDLSLGVDLVQQSKEALLAAACSAADPKPFFRAGSNAKATDYLRTVRLGQTEHGSFIVTLISPVAPELQPVSQASLWPEFASEPFSRQVTRTLARAFDAVSTAISEVGRGGNIEAFVRGVEQGISANLCAAIGEFVKDGDGLDFSLTWARTRPAPKARHRNTFSAADAPVLEEAAKMLKNREPRKNEVLEGYVRVLKREQEARTGRIQVKAFVDGQVRSVAVDLPREDYERAFKGQSIDGEIRIEGDLEFKGQRWFLRNPRNLEVIQERETEE